MQYQFKILNATTCYNGFLRVKLYYLKHELFSGHWSAEFTRECLERGNAVAVLLYDPNQDQVVLVEQFRIGAIAFSSNPWLLEIVAGVIDDPTETNHKTAEREALEEAGCQIIDLFPIYHYLVSPGGTSETVKLFCGIINVSNILFRSTYGITEEHEDIRIHVVTRTKAMQLVRDGCIISASAIIALQWLEINHQQFTDIKK